MTHDSQMLEIKPDLSLHPDSFGKLSRQCITPKDLCMLLCDISWFLPCHALDFEVQMVPRRVPRWQRRLIGFLTSTGDPRSGRRRVVSNLGFFCFFHVHWGCHIIGELGTRYQFNITIFHYFPMPQVCFVRLVTMGRLQFSIHSDRQHQLDFQALRCPNGTPQRPQVGS